MIRIRCTSCRRITLAFPDTGALDAVVDVEVEHEDNCTWLQDLLDGKPVFEEAIDVQLVPEASA